MSKLYLSYVQVISKLYQKLYLSYVDVRYMLKIYAPSYTKPPQGAPRPPKPPQDAPKPPKPPQGAPCFKTKLPSALVEVLCFSKIIF
jgi:hypothetical protein